MALLMGLLFLGRKVLRRGRKVDGTERRAEMEGQGKRAEMATADRNWHAAEMPTGVERESGVGMRGYVDRG